jgi:hypothetical protein
MYMTRAIHQTKKLVGHVRHFTSKEPKHMFLEAGLPFAQEAIQLAHFYWVSSKLEEGYTIGYSGSTT